MPRCLIGLGANLGDSRNTLEQALRMLDQSGIQVDRCSNWVRCKPVGPASQATDVRPGEAGGPAAGESPPDYVNGVALLTTELAPLPLLDRLLEVETTLGRRRDVRWGSRTVDLDLLLYDAEVIAQPRLLVPHPWMLARRFVLAPAAAIAPDWEHPLVGATLQTLDAALERPVGMWLVADHEQAGEPLSTLLDEVESRLQHELPEGLVRTVDSPIRVALGHDGALQMQLDSRGLAELRRTKPRLPRLLIACELDSAPSNGASNELPALLRDQVGCVISLADPATAYVDGCLGLQVARTLKCPIAFASDATLGTASQRITFAALGTAARLVDVE
ncbi:MAG: 2-amino-4-hydroxy-6-hydroxymethyldihydropteridine diphosphokinase [Planctomycetales bacterium]|nr:2-amino-4-hydroxy-6-hydroxymethyldihydropteridine diphosphokinase [Planctomycetales bacterium]